MTLFQLCVFNSSHHSFEKVGECEEWAGHSSCMWSSHFISDAKGINVKPHFKQTLVEVVSSSSYLVRNACHTFCRGVGYRWPEPSSDRVVSKTMRKHICRKCICQKVVVNDANKYGQVLMHCWRERFRTYCIK